MEPVLNNVNPYQSTFLILVSKPDTHSVGVEIPVPNLGICKLCLQLTTLQPLKDSLYAEEFNNFQFIQMQIGNELPEHACTHCISKLDEICVFLKKIQICLRTYKDIEVNPENVENVEVNQESVEPTWETDHMYYKTNDDEFSKITAENLNENEKELVDLSNLRTISEVNENLLLNDSINLNNENLVSQSSVEISFPSLDIDTDLKEFAEVPEICLKSDTSEDSLNSDDEKSTQCEPNLKCPLSNLNGPDKKELSNNCDEIAKNFVCHICSKRYQHKATLKRHIKVHGDAKQYICEICGKAYIRETELKDHKNVHTNEKPYVCTYCGKGFGKQPGLSKHIRLHEKGKLRNIKLRRKDKNSEQVTCDICYRSFSDRGIHNHMASHDGDKKYECAKCNIKFKNLKLYRSHTESHTKKTHKCPVCSRRFLCYQHLEDHIRVHTGERPFRCADCEKTFQTSNNLKRHRRLKHNDNRGKLFECKFCKKTLTLKRSLVIHEKIHSGEKPYTCQFCGEGFVSARTRQQHVKSHHKEETIECIGSENDMQVDNVSEDDALSDVL